MEGVLCRELDQMDEYEDGSERDSNEGPNQVIELHFWLKTSPLCDPYHWNAGVLSGFSSDIQRTLCQLSYWTDVR